MSHRSFNQHVHDFEKLRRNLKCLQKFKFVNVEKTYGCYPHQDFETHFCSTLFNTNVYLRMSFRALDIFTPKDKQIFKPKMVKMLTKTFFFVQEFGCFEDYQKPVWTSLSRNCQKLPCTETRIHQPSQVTKVAYEW